MKQTINFSDFIDDFHKYGRYDQFGYDGLRVLFDWLEEVDDEMELDVVGLCCEFAIASVEDIAANYSVDIDGMDDEESYDAVMDYLNDNTMVCGWCVDGIVYQQF